MLQTIEGAAIHRVAHADRFQVVTRLLGPERTEAVRSGLDQLIEHMEPDRKTARRIFSSSHLGSALTPWPHPISHLYDVAWELEGDHADEGHVQGEAAMIFGLFVWECLMRRAEDWMFYDPNLSPADPNREITGKVYFEAMR